jgi:hypothetical protein
MKVVLTNAQIMSAVKSINDLMDEKEKLPFEVNWNIVKNFKRLCSIMENIDEFEKKLVEQYAIKENEKIKIFPDNQFKIKPEFINVFNKERIKLFEHKETVEIDMINAKDLKGYNIQPIIVFNITFMIQDESYDQMKE